MRARGRERPDHVGSMGHGLEKDLTPAATRTIGGPGSGCLYPRSLGQLDLGSNPDTP